MEKQIEKLIEISIIAIIILVGLCGNIVNLNVFSNEKLKKVTTFRYLYYISIIDMILLIILPIQKLISFNFIQISNEYTKIIAFRLMTFSLNYFSQMNSWLFMAANLNKANLIINELKGLTNKKRNRNSHLKILISICLFLLILNSHYLMFLNINNSMNSHKNDTNLIIPTVNKTHHFVYKQMMKSPMNNLTKININRIRNKSNLFKFNQIDYQKDSEIQGFHHFSNEYYEIFLAKHWFWIQMAMFDMIPLVINLVSTLIVGKCTNKLNNQNRKKFNKQFFLFFLISNLFILLLFLTIIYFKLIYNQKFYVQMWLLHIIITFGKHSFSFILYLFTFNIYRSTFSNLFMKHNNNDEYNDHDQINMRNSVKVTTCTESRHEITKL